MARWHHQCYGHEFGQTLGDGEGQGGLVCCSSWGCKELDMTEHTHTHSSVAGIGRKETSRKQIQSTSEKPLVIG